MAEDKNRSTQEGHGAQKGEHDLNHKGGQPGQGSEHPQGQTPGQGQGQDHQHEKPEQSQKRT